MGNLSVNKKITERWWKHSKLDWPLVARIQLIRVPDHLSAHQGRLRLLLCLSACYTGLSSAPCGPVGPSNLRDTLCAGSAVQLPCVKSTAEMVLTRARSLHHQRSDVLKVRKWSNKNFMSFYVCICINERLSSYGNASVWMTKSFQPDLNDDEELSWKMVSRWITLLKIRDNAVASLCVQLMWK